MATFLGEVDLFVGMETLLAHRMCMFVKIANDLIFPVAGKIWKMGSKFSELNMPYNLLHTTLPEQAICSLTCNANMGRI